MIFGRKWTKHPKIEVDELILPFPDSPLLPKPKRTPDDEAAN
jgi:hypothetical protein